MYRGTWALYKIFCKMKPQLTFQAIGYLVMVSLSFFFSVWLMKILAQNPPTNLCLNPC